MEQSLRLLEWGATPERHHRKKVEAEGLVAPLRFDPLAQTREWMEFLHRRMEMVWGPLLFLLRLQVRERVQGLLPWVLHFRIFYRILRSQPFEPVRRSPRSRGRWRLCSGWLGQAIP